MVAGSKKGANFGFRNQKKPHHGRRKGKKKKHIIPVSPWQEVQVATRLIKKKSSHISMSLFLLTFILGCTSLVSSNLFLRAVPDENNNASEVNALDITGFIYFGGEGEVVVQNAQILVKELNRVALSNGEGYYCLKNIKPGTYTIVATQESYGSHTKVVTFTSKSTISSLDFQLDDDNKIEVVEFLAFQRSNDYNLNYFYLLASFGTLCALFALLLVRFTGMFTLPFVMGILSITSYGFFLGSLCGFVAVLFLFYSRSRKAAHSNITSRDQENG